MNEFIISPSLTPQFGIGPAGLSYIFQVSFTEQSPAFDPLTDIPNLAIWYTADTNVVPSSGLVNSWTDRNQGLVLTASAPTEKPTATSNVINGQSAITFATSNGLTSSVTTQNILTGSNHIIAYVYKSTADAYQYLTQQQTSNQFYIFDNKENSVYIRFPTSNEFNMFSFGIPTGSWNVYITTKTGSLGRTIINDYQTAYLDGYATTIPSQQGRFSIGNTSFGHVGDIAEVLIANTYSDALVTSIGNYLNTKYNTYYTSSKYVVFDGNSLSYGTGTSDRAYCYPNVCLNRLGIPEYIGINLGISGQKGTEMLTSSVAKVDPIYKPGKSIYVCWEGSNDLANILTASASYQPIAALCLGRKQLGYKVIVLTTLPFGTDNAVDTTRQQFNTLIRNNYTSFADVLCDVALDPLIGPSGSQTNLTYFDADKTHLKDAGYSIVANYVTASIKSISW